MRAHSPQLLGARVQGGCSGRPCSGLGGAPADFLTSTPYVSRPAVTAAPRMLSQDAPDSHGKGQRGWVELSSELSKLTFSFLGEIISVMFNNSHQVLNNNRLANA